MGAPTLVCAALLGCLVVPTVSTAAVLAPGVLLPLATAGGMDGAAVRRGLTKAASKTGKVPKGKTAKGKTAKGGTAEVSDDEANFAEQPGDGTGGASASAGKKSARGGATAKSKATPTKKATPEAEDEGGAEEPREDLGPEEEEDAAAASATAAAESTTAERTTSRAPAATTTQRATFADPTVEQQPEVPAPPPAAAEQPLDPPPVADQPPVAEQPPDDTLASDGGLEDGDAEASRRLTHVFVALACGVVALATVVAVRHFRGRRPAGGVGPIKTLHNPGYAGDRTISPPPRKRAWGTPAGEYCVPTPSQRRARGGEYAAADASEYTDSQPLYSAADGSAVDGDYAADTLAEYSAVYDVASDGAGPVYDEATGNPGPYGSFGDEPDYAFGAADEPTYDLGAEGFEGFDGPPSPPQQGMLSPGGGRLRGGGAENALSPVPTPGGSALRRRPPSGGFGFSPAVGPKSAGRPGSGTPGAVQVMPVGSVPAALSAWREEEPSPLPPPPPTVLRRGRSPPKTVPRRGTTERLIGFFERITGSRPDVFKENPLYKDV